MVAITDHPAAKQPADAQIGIWRYMDFAKFVAMLKSGSLYFSRLDQLGDPFEGTLSKAEFDHWKEVAEIGEAEGNIPNEWKGRYFDVLLDIHRRNRRCNYVSCWHMSKNESEAMWQLYSSSECAIALCSRYQLLADTLPDKISRRCYLGVVEYANYDIEQLPTGNMLHSIMHKRDSFRHEEECRAVIYHGDPGPEDAHELESYPEGLDVPIDLEQLVERIVIAPTAPPWFKEIVLNVAKTYGFTFSVEQSNLIVEPYI